MTPRPRAARITRRRFLRTSTAAGSAALLAAGSTPAVPGSAAGDGDVAPLPVTAPIDLSPARWIWYPSERCLQNTFVLFRRDLDLSSKPRRATGWVLADSRYLLSVNGRRVQWGPAPSDPRWQEVDPVDLTGILEAGRNTIGATVLFYGQGDGTWPMGKPGFIFRLELETPEGTRDLIVSDGTWRALLARSWRPGQYKRWYLRALQEEFDARLHPWGWDRPDHALTADWLPAMELDNPSDKPSSCSGYPEYMLDMQGDRSTSYLFPRSIPLLDEEIVPVKRIAESFRIRWKRPAEEYFECVTPGAHDAERADVAGEEGPGAWRVSLDGDRAVALTFELEEQIVGWPRFSIEAPEGTIVEILVQEGHRLGGPALLNTHFHAWTRCICRGGMNRFETFDFESCRWIQLHIRGARGEVRVSDVGVRRRRFPWPRKPHLVTSEPALNRLIDATINTIHNSAQETCVDGMGRERQQYSGDGGHQLHAIHLAWGESRLPARFVRTFSQGMTLDGYFLDCWPAYDRLARLMERQLQMSGWGPILDHGVGFNFDCMWHYLYTGDVGAIREAYPRLLRFREYLRGILGRDGLLPVEGIGVPSVWIDHVAYRRQRHKQCAFNLYAAAMLEHALPTLAGAVGDKAQAEASRTLGREIRAAATSKYWDDRRGLFVNNLPWLSEEGEPRLCDRSLATAILFDQCPEARTGPAVQALAELPPEMGLSYPCNAGWRLWALGKGGRSDVILADLRTRWATMDSVRLNNTIQEDWTAAPDSGSQWSHCAVAPVYVLYMSILGLRPIEPGFAKTELRPQLADLESLEAVAHTVRGPVTFRSSGKPPRRELTIELPAGSAGELVLPAGESPPLERLGPGPVPGTMRHALPGGRETRLTLREG